MKTIILNFTLLMFSTLIYSQSPILNLSPARQSGAYYKDIDNELDKFVGTWIYANGNTSFKLILEKRIMKPYGNFFTDLIIGGYQYIENGDEKVNWLTDVNSTHTDIRHHRVFGRYFLDNGSYMPICSTCPANERILSVSIDEPNGPSRFLYFRFKSTPGLPNQIIIQPMNREMLVWVTGQPKPYYVLPLDLNFTLDKQ